MDEMLHQSGNYKEQLSTLEDLEDGGLKLQYLVKECINTDKNEGKLFDFYEIWKVKLLTFSEKIKIRDFEISVKKPDGVNSFLSDIIFEEHIPQGKVKTYTNNKYPRTEAKRQIKAMEVGILERMTALSLLRETLLTEKKRKVVVHTVGNNKKICLAGDAPRCYLIKGQETKRFDIVCMLLNTKTGKSASDIAVSLHKDGENKIVQDNIKKEIKKINILFRKNCEASEDLISHSTNSGKNIYFLNEKQFIFEKQK